MVVYFRRLVLSKWITKKTWKMLVMAFYATNDDTPL
jgi:hypothetical protein